MAWPPGFVGSTRFGQVLVLVHWRFLVAGAFIALVAGADLEGFIAYCAAYAAVFAIHEAAHAIAARRLGLRVHAVVLMGHGGRCLVQVPRNVRDTFQVYVAGMKPDGFSAGIELLNDDTSPMELVVEMLERFGGLDREAALAAMMTIHRQGGLLLPLPNLAIAELAAESITREARARGHALVCRAVSTA